MVQADKHSTNKPGGSFTRRSMSRLKDLSDCLSDRLARRAGLSLGAAFVLLYLYSVGTIVIVPGADLALERPTPSVFVLSDWAAKMWTPIAPFVWEPVAAVYLSRSFALFISVPNLLLALLLGTLVALNMTVAIARARLMVSAKTGRGVVRGFIASLPALLTGFTCCVPTLVLALGSLAAGFTVASIAIAPYLLPIALVALIANLIWGLRQFSCAFPTSGNQNQPRTLLTISRNF